MSQKKEKEKEIIIAETNKNIVEDKLNDICVHEWTDDYIDITPELSQNICYCIKCEITKR